MKKFVITLLAVTSLLVGAAMSSCSQSKNGKEGSEAGEAVDNSSPEMLAVQIEKDGRWSFYGKDKKDASFFNIGGFEIQSLSVRSAYKANAGSVLIEEAPVVEEVVDSITEVVEY